MTEISQLVYASIVNSDTPAGADDDILQKAIAFNTSLGVTGFLHKENGIFLQVLEGETQAVQTIMDRITRDERHHSIEVLMNRPTYIRDFAEWAMAYNDTRELTFKLVYGKHLGNPRDINNVDAYAFLKTCADAKRKFAR